MIYPLRIIQGWTVQPVKRSLFDVGNFASVRDIQGTMLPRGSFGDVDL